MMNCAARALNGATAFSVKCRLNKVYQQTEPVSSEFQPMTTFSAHAGLRWCNGRSSRVRSNAAGLQSSNSGVTWHVSDVSGFRDDILLHEELWLVRGVLPSAVLRSWGRHQPDWVSAACSSTSGHCCEKSFFNLGLVFSILSARPMSLCVAQHERWGSHWR